MGGHRGDAGGSKGPVLCSEGVGIEEVNYRKLRIGAGNRTNAVVTLGRGPGGAPTAQGVSIHLGHILLVPLPQPGPGGLCCRVGGGPGLAKLWEEITIMGCRN